MVGDQTLFHRMDMVEAGWCVVEPILGEWRRSNGAEMATYEPETSGPPEADLLTERDGRSWRC
jgi:glucose-6-phosphate 1-dehydrogenase